MLASIFISEQNSVLRLRDAEQIFGIKRFKYAFNLLKAKLASFYQFEHFTFERFNHRMLVDLGIQNSFNPNPKPGSLIKTVGLNTIFIQFCLAFYELSLGYLIKKYQIHKMYNDLKNLDNRLLQDIGLNKEVLLAMEYSNSFIHDKNSKTSNDHISSSLTADEFNDHMLADLGLKPFEKAIDLSQEQYSFYITFYNSTQKAA
ncbi:MAG: hypothetical protein K1X44_00950 [Alphaproteobacteria bacterium]|nr:hypothetical protein [Alphaproteobacteria bacterium]